MVRDNKSNGAWFESKRERGQSIGIESKARPGATIVSSWRISKRKRGRPILVRGRFLDKLVKQIMSFELEPELELMGISALSLLIRLVPVVDSRFIRKKSYPKRRRPPSSSLPN
eukprot:scaffold151486_cov57-Attheya_sp.AAC.3